MKKLLLALAALVLVPTLLLADVPRLISYQGRLAHADGTPVTGSYNLRFTLYDSEEGGVSVWSEDHHDVLFANGGLYNVLLSPGSVDFSKPYWLGISIDGGSELSPRYPLTTSPYAIHALEFPDSIKTRGQKFVGDENSVFGVMGEGPRTGVFGRTSSDYHYDAGVYGVALSGSNASGIRGVSYGNGSGVKASRGFEGPWADLASRTHAGYFGGDVHITGRLTTDDTLTYLVPFSSFVGVEVEYSPGLVHLQEDVSSEISLYAPVILPQGAQVIRVISYWQDNDSNHNLDIQLVRYSQSTFSSEEEVIANIHSNGSPGFGYTEWTGEHLVDYENTSTSVSYNIKAKFPAGISQSSGLRSVKVYYLRR